MDPALAPGYLNVVTRPMDLGTVMTRLEDGYYAHPGGPDDAHARGAALAATAAAADPAVDASAPVAGPGAALMACVADVRQVRPPGPYLLPIWHTIWPLFSPI